MTTQTKHNYCTDFEDEAQAIMERASKELANASISSEHYYLQRHHLIIYNFYSDLMGYSGNNLIQLLSLFQYSEYEFHHSLTH